MRSFAVIRPQIITVENITVSFQEPVKPRLQVTGLKQPKPHSENYKPHVIEMKRVSENTVHLIQKNHSNFPKQGKKSQANSQSSRVASNVRSTPRKEVAAPQTPHKQEPVHKEIFIEQAEKTHKKRPIFAKMERETMHRDEEVETQNSVSSICLRASCQQISESSDIYFQSAYYRKMKGEQHPYASTYRTRDHKKANLQHLRGADSKFTNSQILGNLHQFNNKYKRVSIFARAKGNQEQQPQNVSYFSPASTVKRPLQQQPKDSTSSIQAVPPKIQQRPHSNMDLSSRIIKLKPKGYRPNRRNLEDSKISSSVSVEILSLMPIAPFII